MSNSVLYSLLGSTRDVASLASLARPEFDDSRTMSLAPAEVATNYVLARVAYLSVTESLVHAKA